MYRSFSLLFLTLSLLLSLSVPPLPRVSASLPSWLVSSISDPNALAYIEKLDTSALSLVHRQCSTDGIYDCGAAYDDTDSSDVADQLEVALTAEPVDPCVADTNIEYDTGLHVMAIVVIFFLSLAGPVLPLLGQCFPCINIDPFVYVLGKCAGTGILLACALIHMLLPATEALSSPCLSKAFTEDYTAYSYLFCMLAIIGMHSLDFFLAAFVRGQLMAQQAKQAGSSSSGVDSTGLLPVCQRKVLVSPQDGAQVVVSYTAPTAVKDGSPSEGVIMSPLPSSAVPLEICVDSNGDADADTEGNVFCEVLQEASPSQSCQEISHNKHAHNHNRSHNHNHNHSHGHGHKLPPHSHSHTHSDHDHDGHIHTVLLVEGLEATVAAYLLEFGVTLHSVFVGLSVGISDNSQLRALLVALVFHQFFEGLALGSRIAEAGLSSRVQQTFLVALFAFATPVGQLVGLFVKTSLNANGPTYNYTSGILDAVCSGILLYIGLTLLTRDFASDMKTSCKNVQWKKAAMFGALWTGAGLMAFIGKYL